MSSAVFKRGLIGAVFAVFALAGLTACHSGDQWHNTNMTGSMPRLSFTMTRARDGKIVTARDYRGKVVLLYFGYTFCPDVCPRTLSSIAAVLKKMKSRAHEVRVLFVTVDPRRDTLPVLKQYESLFGPEFDALRGTPDELAALARRYRVSYSVTPAKRGQPYIVTHSAAVYAFDKTGAIRLLLSSMNAQNPNIADTAADLTRLVDRP